MKNKMVICNSYLFLMLGVFPLFFHNFYYDIYQTKFWFAAVVTCLFFSLQVLVCGVGREQFAQLGKKEGMIWYLSFLFFAVISVAFSQHRIEAFFGNAGRYNGLFIYLVYLMGYYMIFQTEKISIKIFYVMEGTGILTGFLGILNHFSIDPFGFTKGLGVIENFMSTLGNTNCFVEYTGMIMVVAGGMYILESKKNSRVWHGFVYMISCMALILAGPETAYIAFLIFIMGTPFIIKKQNELIRYIILVEYLCIMFLSISFAYHQDWNFIHNSKYLSDITFLILNHWIYVGGIFLVFFLLGCSIYFCTFFQKISQGGIVLIKKIYAGCIIAAGIVFLVIFVMTNSGWTDLFGGFGKMFYLTDEWGTNRGYIWKKSIEYFKKMPVLQKWIGIGPDTMYFAYSEMNAEVAGAAIDNTHNMLLQLLITHGIIGVAAWTGWIINTLMLCVRKGKNHGIYQMLGMAIICYYAMSMFGVNMINSSAIAVLLMGMARCDFSEYEGITENERFLGGIIASVVVLLLLLAGFMQVLKADEMQMLNNLLAG